MEDKKKKRQIAKIIVFITSIFVIFMSVTYAFITQTLTGEKQVVVSAGVLDLVLEEENAITISNALPMYDEVGMIQDPFTFRLVNNGSNVANYKLKLVDVTLQTVERKCSDLGEITLDSPLGCRETVYPEELRTAALMLCQGWYADVSTEEECIEASEYDGVHYNNFEEFIDKSIYYEELEDTRILKETYPDKVVEVSVWELSDWIIRYGVTRNGENIIGSIEDLEYTWKIDDSVLRARALEVCKNWYPEVTDEASCLETLKDDEAPFETFDDFVGEYFWPNGNRRFTLDAGKIGAKETINYDLRLWISEYIEDIEDIEGMTFSFKIDVEVSQEIEENPFGINVIKTLAQESTSTFPNFKQISSETNGRGIYKYKEDGKDIYYWRGKVDEVEGAANHVLFGGYCWEMVRTTSAGGIKIIYDGEPIEVDGVKTCTNRGMASLVSDTSSFNSKESLPAYVGYMYGNTVYESKTKELDDDVLATQGILYGNDVEWNGTEYELKKRDGDDYLYSSIGSWALDKINIGGSKHYTCFNVDGKCETVSYLYYTGDINYLYYIELNNGITIEKALEQMYSNEKSSTIKTSIENWFESTDLDEEENLSKLEDAVYCNDRSIIDLNHGWNKDGDMTKPIYYSPSKRIDDGTPDLSCRNEVGNRDRFTYKDTVNGNGLLKWPVGLLTADEIILAGGQSLGIINKDFYLYAGYSEWTFSPLKADYKNIEVATFDAYGSMSESGLKNSLHFRPVVTLAAGVKITGLGTETSPFEVK